MAFFGLMMCSVLLFLTCLVGFVYARRSPRIWHARIPPVWLKRIDTSAPESKVFPMLVLMLFVGVPIGGFAPSHRYCLEFQAVRARLKSRACYVSHAWFFGTPNADSQIKLVEDRLPDGICGKSVQVFTG
jgi:hypothetical protein